MVVFGQDGCIGAKWLYSRKSVCNWAKVIYSGKSGCIQAKVVVFGQKWFYSGNDLPANGYLYCTFSGTLRFWEDLNCHLRDFHVQVGYIQCL